MISFTTVAIARPDIGLQLKEKELATSYGAPSASITNLNQYLPPSASFQTPYVSTSVPFYDGSVTTASPLFQSTVSSTPAPVYSLPSVSTTASPFISTTPSPLYSEPIINNNIFGSSPIPSGGLVYNQDAAFYGGQYPSVQSSQYTPISPAVVQKHVYFYEAPDEPQALPPTPIPVDPPKRNVKIIFIKAPQYAQPIYPQIPVIPQNQEKTIVYVLVKKPEEQQQIVVPTQPPTVPAKPEVYFIKYKNQQEAEEKVSNTLNEHSNSGANIITSGIDTASIASNSLIGNPYIGGSIYSTTESPLGLLDAQNGFLSTSTIDPLLSNYYSTLGTDLSSGSNGGQYFSSTESPIVRSTPYTFAPVHPTYGPPKFKK